jgi:hypothetical protein
MADALPHWRLWELFGVRYVATWEHDCPAPFACHRIAMRGDEWAKDTVYLHRIEGGEPARAWVAHEARIVADSEALALLAEPDFDRLNEVLLPEGAPESPLWSGGGPVWVASEVRVLDRAPERMRLRVETEAAGWLVVAEWHYPGWQARIDGERQRVYRADYGLRAVQVPAGSHWVEFVYRPISVYAGAALSTLTFLGVALLWALSPRVRHG